MNSEAHKFEAEQEPGDAAKFSSGKHPMLEEANQMLRRHLREPTKAIPFRWSCSILDDREIIDVNTIYPLVHAWRQLDVSVAESLLKSIFFLQNKDGTVAARYLPDGTPLTDEAPWPLLAQSVKMVWKSGGNIDFIKVILPRLYRYIEWMLYYFDPQRESVLQWQHMSEALIPGNFSSRQATPDLTILLICEIEALKFLENECPGTLTEMLDLGPELNRLNHNALELYFWDTSKGGISIRDTISGAGVKTPLFYTLMLPMGTSISSELTIQAKPLLAAALNNFSECNILPACGNSAFNSIYAFLMIAAARDGGMPFEHKRFIHHLWKLIGHNFLKNKILPQHLLFTTDATEEQSLEKDSAEALITGALISYIGNIILTPEPAPSSGQRLMQRLNRHPLFAIFTPLILAGIAILTIAGICAIRKTPVSSELEAGIALASQYYTEGDYEAALTICHHYAESSSYTTVPQILEARILYNLEKYDQAEELYRSLLDKDGMHPAIELNLALAVYRQGRLEEATSLYQNFIDTYGADLPTEAERATLAIKLIEEHGAKKRGRQNTSRRSG